jgi:hypothetical protein
MNATVNSFQHPDAQTIRTRWAGEPFDVHACVEALFTLKLSPSTPWTLINRLLSRSSLRQTA